LFEDYSMSAKTLMCSMADCRKAATLRVAAPWSDGVSSGSRTFGHACPDHAGAVIASAEHRLLRSTLPPGESIGDVVASRREDVPVVMLQAR
jgi:hypothetical protein